MYVLRFWKRWGTIRQKQNFRANANEPNPEMFLPKMPTPYGVSWQTIFLWINLLFGVISEVYKKAVIAP